MAPGAPLAPPMGAPGTSSVGPAPGPVARDMADSLSCVQAELARSPIMAEPAPAPTGWRLRLSIWSSPPSGWVDKGSILHDGARLTYVPNGATRGLAEETVRDAVHPVLLRCR